MIATEDLANIHYTQLWPYISHKIQWSGLILAYVIATTPFATTLSPLLLSICVSHLRSNLGPALSSRSDGQKSPENGVFVSLQLVASIGLVSPLKASPQKAHLFCCPSFQINYSTKLFLHSNSSTTIIVFPTYFDDFQLGTSRTCLHHQLVGLGHPFLLTGLRISMTLTSISGQ